MKNPKTGEEVYISPLYEAVDANSAALSRSYHMAKSLREADNKFIWSFIGEVW